MKTLWLTVFGVIAFTSALAQALPPQSLIFRTIQGEVVEAQGQAGLSFVTVAILEAGQSQPTKTTLTDTDGSFTFTGLLPKPYTLALSYLGYQTKTISLPASPDPEINLGQIMLSPATTQLQEVQVLGHRPLVEQDLDKLTYHVELDPESLTLSALEMFRKVPMLSIDGDDNLQLNGSDSYQILINGKTSALFLQDPSEIFKSIPASSIKRVEVITNPPARYDAEGLGGIINIVTHRKTISGYNGSVNASGSSPTGANLGANLSARAGKFGFSGNFRSNTSTSPPSQSNFLREDRVRQTQLRQVGGGTSQNSSRSGSTELSYELGPRSQLSASFGQNRNQGANDFLQRVELLNAAGAPTQAYRNLRAGQNSNQGQDLGLDFQRSFRKSTEQTLTLAYKVSNNASANLSDFSVVPLLNHPGQISHTENESGTREHTLQADYVQPIRKQTLEVGLKSVARFNNSDYFYQNQNPETGLLVLDPRLSNNFDHYQQINAAYTSLSLRKERWGLRLGARLEETRVEANFRSSRTLATPHYHNLIPNLNVSHKFKGNSTLRLSYTQRLERPGLYHINPYVDLTDPRNISYGNPDLDPATNHSFNLGYNTYVKRTSLNAGLVHQFTNNSIQRFTTLGEDTVARSTYANIGQRQTFGLTLSGNTTLFHKLSLNLNSTTTYVEVTSTLRGLSQTNAGLTLNASGNLSYRFSKTWRASGNVGYSSPQILLQGRSAGFVSNSLTLNREVLKNNKGSLSLSVRNPFQKYRRFLSEVNDPHFYQLNESYAVIRQYTAAFNYRFGKVQAGGTRKRRITQSEE